MKPTLRDLLAMPFMLIAFGCLWLAVQVGSEWTADKMLELMNVAGGDE